MKETETKQQKEEPLSERRVAYSISIGSKDSKTLDLQDYLEQPSCNQLVVNFQRLVAAVMICLVTSFLATYGPHGLRACQTECLHLGLLYE